MPNRPDIPVTETLNRGVGADLDGVVHGDCGHEDKYQQPDPFANFAVPENFVEGINHTNVEEPERPNNYTLNFKLTFEDSSIPGARCEVKYTDGQPSSIVMSSDRHGGEYIPADDEFTIGFFNLAQFVMRAGSGQSTTRSLAFSQHHGIPYPQHGGMAQAMMGRPNRPQFGPSVNY